MATRRKKNELLVNAADSPKVSEVLLVRPHRKQRSEALPKICPRPMPRKKQDEKALDDYEGFELIAWRMRILLPNSWFLAVWDWVLILVRDRGENRMPFRSTRRHCFLTRVVIRCVCSSYRSLCSTT